MSHLQAMHSATFDTIKLAAERMGFKLTVNEFIVTQAEADRAGGWLYKQVLNGKQINVHSFTPPEEISK